MTDWGDNPRGTYEKALERIAELEEQLQVQTNYLQAIYSNAYGDAPSVWQISLIVKKALEGDK